MNQSVCLVTANPGAEIRQKMPGALFALLMTAVTGII